MGIAMRDGTYIIEASEAQSELTLKTYDETAAGAGCIIDDLEVDDAPSNISAIAFSLKPVTNVMLSLTDGEGSMEDDRNPRILTPIRPAAGWSKAPEDAKEFTFLLLKGYVRRYALILKNAEDIYDTVALYRSKKDEAPLTILKGALASDFQVIDQYQLEDKVIDCNRIATLWEIAPDGSRVQMIFSSAMDYTRDELFYPRSLYQQVAEAAGYVPPTPSGGAPTRMKKFTKALCAISIAIRINISVSSSICWMKAGVWSSPLTMVS